MYRETCSMPRITFTMSTIHLQCYGGTFDIFICVLYILHITTIPLILNVLLKNACLSLDADPSIVSSAHSSRSLGNRHARSVGSTTHSVSSRPQIGLLRQLERDEAGCAMDSLIGVQIHQHVTTTRQFPPLEWTQATLSI
jgi:hypothetical protein